MPGYTLVDFFSSYKVYEGVELGFNVNNLFDKVYTPALSTTSRKAPSATGPTRWAALIPASVGRSS